LENQCFHKTIRADYGSAKYNDQICADQEYRGEVRYENKIMRTMRLFKKISRYVKAIGKEEHDHGHNKIANHMEKNRFRLLVE
jgi:hypothetical protein